MIIKFLQFSFILLTVVSCGNSSEKELNVQKEKTFKAFQKAKNGLTVDSIIRDRNTFFEEGIYNSYVENGKYYLIKCENWLIKPSCPRCDTESVFEIRVGDTILGPPDEHSFIFYTVEKLKENTIQFGFESTFDHHSFDVNKRTTHQGSFIIHCSSKKEFVNLIVDGLDVSEASAKKHIAEGKFYILMKYGNKRGELGNGVSNKDDYCNKMMFNKFGYYKYILDQCVPNEFYMEQINAYNVAVFNYLKAKKGFTFNNRGDMESHYYLALQECQREAYKKKNKK